MYNLSIDRLVGQLMPPFMRHALHLSWLRALLSPVGLLTAQFAQFRLKATRLANVTGQTASVEYYLNHRFFGDGHLRTIFIDESALQPQIFLYPSINQAAPYLYNINEQVAHLNMFSAVDWRGPHFTVNVPSNFTVEPAQLIDIVNKIRPRGFVWELRTYLVDGYAHHWNGKICVQAEGRQDLYVMSWSAAVCIQLPLPPGLHLYTYNWFGSTCIQMVAGSSDYYHHAWTGQVCFQHLVT